MGEMLTLYVDTGSTLRKDFGQNFKPADYARIAMQVQDLQESGIAVALASPLTEQPAWIKAWSDNNTPKSVAFNTDKVRKGKDLAVLKEIHKHLETGSAILAYESGSIPKEKRLGERSLSSRLAVALGETATPDNNVSLVLLGGSDGIYNFGKELSRLSDIPCSGRGSIRDMKPIQVHKNIGLDRLQLECNQYRKYRALITGHDFRDSWLPGYERNANPCRLLEAVCYATKRNIPVFIANREAGDAIQRTLAGESGTHILPQVRT